MKHNIRINGEVKQIDCELGSDRSCQNGREIFEGDKVKATYSDGWIIRGVVEANEHGELFFKSGFCLQDLGNLQSVAKSIEILEED